MLKEKLMELERAKKTVEIATNVFNEATGDNVDTAIYALLAAESRLKILMNG